MPFTFFAHQVPVLPLKMAKPRWFDSLIRTRRFSAWNGTPSEPGPQSPRRFWSPVAIACALAVSVALSAPITAGGLAAAIMRGAWFVFAGLVVGTMAVRGPERRV